MPKKIDIFMGSQQKRITSRKINNVKVPILENNYIETIYYILRPRRHWLAKLHWWLYFLAPCTSSLSNIFSFSWYVFIIGSMFDNVHMHFVWYFISFRLQSLHHTLWRMIPIFPYSSSLVIQSFFLGSCTSWPRSISCLSTDQLHSLCSWTSWLH